LKPYVHNISFIVIALNEEFAIQKCLESIYRLDAQNSELICVDSNSEDNTMEMMKSYAAKIPNTKIFKIEGDCNAAIARNIGIEHAKKDYIFFIDGDVEISEEFIVNALKRINNYSAVCGSLEDVEYDTKYFNIIANRVRYQKKIEGINSHTGGVFLTKTAAISKVGRFDEKLIINEDIDFSLRLGTFEPILYIPVSMGRHHTIPYANPKRLLHRIKMQQDIYTGMLLKKHIRNKNLVYIVKNQSELFFGLPFYFYLLLCILINVKMITLLMPVIAGDLIYGKFQKKDILHRSYSHYLAPLFIINGFFKSRIKKYKYQVKKTY